MTYLDAAHQILKSAGVPLHFEEITQRALAQQLIAPQGLTPEATMGSRLYTETKQESSRFVRVGHGRFGLTDWGPKGIDEHVQKINRDTRDQLAELLLAVPPERFEALIRDLLVQMGFDENGVQVTPYSGDGGIDVVGCYRAAGLTEVNAAVQVKRWKNNVSAPTVTQLRGSLQVHQQGIIITTGGFSRGAREEASAPGKTHIGLIDGEELVELFIKHRVGVQTRPLEVTTLDEDYWKVLAATRRTDGPEGEKVTTQAPPPTQSKSAGNATVIKTARQKTPPVAPETPKVNISFTLLDKSYTVHTWRGVLLATCAMLAERHPASFAERASSVKGRTRQYVADNPDGMISPAQIPGTDLWVEANQSARSVQQLIEKLLATFGHQPDDFAITEA